MNIIRGKVLSKEQNLPIPDVLIVAYDYDPSSRSAPSAGTKCTSAELHAFWASLQSDRLGSVLTDDQGHFELAFDDDLFRVRTPDEARPDLVLFVMAPEDTLENAVVAAEPSNRILHFSAAVRVGAGRIESYIIRIPKARLEQLEVPFGTRPRAGGMLDDEAVLDPMATIAALDQRLRYDAVLAANESFRTLLQAQRDQVTSHVAHGREFIGQLLLRDHAHASGLRAVRSEDRASLLEHSVDEGLQRLGSQAPAVRIPISEATASAIESAGSETTHVLAALSTTLDRVRTRSLADACVAKRMCAAIRGGYAVHPEEPYTGEEVAPTDAALPGSRDEAHATVLSRVLGQIDALRSYDPARIGRRTDPLDLQDALDSLRLRGGPADVTSYHDFHSLQIAFKSVWEAVYDEALGLDGAALYDEWVRVREYVGLPEPASSELAEFRSLTDFLRAVERDASAARGLAERTGTLPNSRGTPVPAVGVGTRRTVVARPGSERGAPGRSAPGGVVRAYAPREAVPARPVGEAAQAHTEVVEAADPLARLGRMMAGLEGRLRQPYAFDIFAPGTCNFGLMVTYRQRWEPESYQVGELVSTMPLAPGEKRTFSAKQVVRKSRAEKEVENALSSLRAESSQTSRADAEIVRKAASSTNFKQTVQGQFGLGDFMQIGSTSEFGVDQRQESEQRKKSFREAVRKASEEYKHERTLEVSTTEEHTSERVTTGEISNPNNEITVTYLFYELQRRYRVSERLHRTRAVLLVAQDVPRPDEIDEDWLLTHEWILRRVLLDDSLAQALDYLRDTLAGDEFAVQVLRATWERNLTVVDEIGRQLDSRSALRDQVRARVVQLLGRVERDDTNRDVAAAIFSGGLSLLFGGGTANGTSLEATREAADRELEFTESELSEVEARLRQATSALEASTDKYVAALRAQLNRRTAIDQLRVHVKENILHYMQAIWAHEPPDQRYFRLYDHPVPWIELEASTHASITREEPEEGRPATTRLIRSLLGSQLKFRVDLSLTPRFTRGGTRPFGEVAEETLIGFKGNFLIFPLKESNPLTEYMLAQYPNDEVIGVLDPDDFGNASIEELEELIRCVEHDQDLDSYEREFLNGVLCDRLVTARKDEETIIVPTGQLYIEALPGAHPVLEDYKLLHRAIDVKKAEAEVRAIELENLRRADRLVAGERQDPDIEKKVIVQRVSGRADERRVTEPVETE